MVHSRLVSTLREEALATTGDPQETGCPALTRRTREEHGGKQGPGLSDRHEKEMKIGEVQQVCERVMSLLVVSLFKKKYIRHLISQDLYLISQNLLGPSNFLEAVRKGRKQHCVKTCNVVFLVIYRVCKPPEL